MVCWVAHQFRGGRVRLGIQVLPRFLPAQRGGGTQRGGLFPTRRPRHLLAFQLAFTQSLTRRKKLIESVRPKVREIALLF